MIDPIYVTTPHDLRVEFGQRVIDARRVRGLSQEELSELPGVPSENVINRVEKPPTRGNGARMDSIEAICSALGIENPFAVLPDDFPSWVDRALTDRGLTNNELAYSLNLGPTSIRNMFGSKGKLKGHWNCLAAYRTLQATPLSEGGVSIDYLRNRVHLSWNRLAQATGLSVEHLRKIGSAGGRPFTAETARIVRKALGARPETMEQIIERNFNAARDRLRGESVRRISLLSGVSEDTITRFVGGAPAHAHIVNRMLDAMDVPPSEMDGLPDGEQC